MTDRIAMLRSRHPLTVPDLESMPDDGRRYELIDGTLVVSPSPAAAHQRMAFRVAVLLDASCPPDLEVMIAPFDVQTAEDSMVQPDVLVARREDIAEANLPVAPVLAVEVLSRSSQLYDRNLKMAHYARIAVPSYWLLDPDGTGGIEVYELRDGGYTLCASGSGSDSLDLADPFPLSLCPARLLGRHGQSGAAPA